MMRLSVYIARHGRDCYHMMLPNEDGSEPTESDVFWTGMDIPKEVAKGLLGKKYLPVDNVRRVIIIMKPSIGD